MKAAVCATYGPPEVVKLENVEDPRLSDDALLVRVHASSVNPLDFFALSRLGYMMRALRARGRPKPERLGTDFAGTVEAVGPRVTRFKPGDAVFGIQTGAFAEYVSVSEAGPLAPKPANVTFEQAAAVPVAGITALQAVRDHARLQAGEKALINGASGGVGTFAVQMAKAWGAEVTAVCSAANVDCVRSLGADRVIDYRAEDFTRASERYDALLDIAGSHSWRECTRVLQPRATFVAVGASARMPAGAAGVLGHLAAVRIASFRSSRRCVLFIAKPNQPDLVTLQQLLEAGRVSPVVDRTYPLTTLPPALRYLHEGHARGKVVITHDVS